MKLRIAKVSTIALVGSMLTACVIQAPPKPNDPYYAPVVNTPPAPAPSNKGSLFSDNTSIVLFSDQKARRVGDIITVVLREKTASSKSSNVELVKDSDINIASTAGTATIFGSVPGAGEYGLGTSLGAARQFKGESDADQSNQLVGEITVTVVNILPNGNLVVRGEKWITLNQGDEFVRISGMVRSEDITPDNTVLSTKLADARIAYSGTGDFAETQRQGWLSRFFNHPIWPF